MLHLYLDGNLIPASQHSPLDEAEFTLHLHEDGPQTGFQANITFTGTAQAYLRERLLTAPDARSRQVAIRIEDDCCPTRQVLYQGLITSRSIDWCSIRDGKPTACQLQVSSFANTPDAHGLRCLRNKLINANYTWPNGQPFHEQPQPQVPYCVSIRPRFVHDLLVVGCIMLVYIMFVLRPVLLTIGFIVGVLNVLISVVRALASGTPDELSLDDLWDSFTQFNEDVQRLITEYIPRWMTACGQYHYAPLVRNYIINVCHACGLDFQSSILNSPSSVYYNLAMLSAPNEEGRDRFLLDANTVESGAVSEFFSLNSPNWTGAELLDALGAVFHARWQVSGNSLRVEAADGAATHLFNVSADDPSLQSLCYQWDDEPVPAGLLAEYPLDGLDSVGDEARFLYNDVVPFDNPPLVQQKGLLQPQIRFGAARFRGDGLSVDPLLFWEFIFTPLDWVGLSPIKDEFDHNLLLKNGKCVLPKLLLLEDNFDRTHAIVRRQFADGRDRFNVPMWFAAAFPPYNPDGQYDEPANSPKVITGPNMFAFWQGVDPRLAPQKGLRFELRLQRRCAYLSPILAAINAGTRDKWTIGLPFEGEILAADVERLSFSKGSIVVSGKV
jgi:hypothetical protein